MAYAGLHLLDALLATGRLAEARSCAIETWESCRAMNLPLAADPTTLFVALSGRLRMAARLAGYTRAQYARLNFAMPWVAQNHLQRIDALVRDRVDEEERALLAAEGGRWSDEEAYRAAFESNEA